MSYNVHCACLLLLLVMTACQPAPGAPGAEFTQPEPVAVAPQALASSALPDAPRPSPAPLQQLPLALETLANEDLAAAEIPIPTPYPALTPYPAPTPYPALTPHPAPPPRVQSPPPPPPLPLPEPPPPDPLAPYRPAVTEYVFHESFSFNPYSNIQYHIFVDQMLPVHFTPGQKVLIFGGPVSPPNLNRVVCCVGADDWIRLRVNGHTTFTYDMNSDRNPILRPDAIDMTHAFVPGMNQVQFQAGNTFIPTSWVTPLILRVMTPSAPYTNDLGMRFGPILPGSMHIGGYDSEGGPDDERPRHAISINTIYLQQTEVTQQQWLTVMGEWPADPPDAAHGLGPEHPAYNVSWQDAQRFIDRLNEKGPGRYRLPTETEWEYAARTRSNSTWGCGNEESCLAERAWYGTEGAQPVAQKAPALWELEKTPLYDMQGNVAEWVQDWYGPYQDAILTNPQGPLEGSEKVMRGGHWQDPPLHLRPAARQKAPPETRSPLVGFRLVWEP